MSSLVLSPLLPPFSPSPLPPFLPSPLSPSLSSPSPLSAVVVKAEIVGVEPRHPLPLPMAVPGGRCGHGNADMPPTLMSLSSPGQSHHPRPSPTSSSSLLFSCHRCCRRRRCGAPRAHNCPGIPSSHQRNDDDDGASINGVVLPVAAAPCGLLLCPLSVIDENNDDGDNITFLP